MTGLWAYVRLQEVDTSPSQGRKLQEFQFNVTIPEEEEVDEIVLMTDQLFTLKEYLQDGLCQSIFYYDHEYATETPFFRLAVKKYRKLDAEKLEDGIARLEFNGDKVQTQI